MKELLRVKGNNGSLVITDSSIILKRGLSGFFGGGHTSDKTIPLSKVVGVDFKKAGVLLGHITIETAGTEIKEVKPKFIEGTLPLTSARLKDPNSIVFIHKGNTAFEEAKELILSLIN